MKSKTKAWKIGFVFGLAVLAFCAWSGPAVFAQQGTPLPGSAIPQFIDPLPDLEVITGTHETDATQIVLESKEFEAQVMPSTFVPADTTNYDGKTSVWGYLPPAESSRDSYIGPVIVATRGSPTQIKWVNNLGDTSSSNLEAWITSTDQTLHWADPKGEMGSTSHYVGPIPDVTHLHGGEQPAEIDGGPDAWYLSDAYNSTDFPAYSAHGAAYYSKDDPLNGSTHNYTIYRYPNVQEAANLWFHPHPLGVTRLNVYAGLAGAYILTDSGNPPPSNLPGPADIIPLVIQDRMFDTNGQLYFPNVGINPEHPFWIPEFVGDTIVVNGKVWPFKNLDAKRYRFIILNGSNARTYELFLVNPVTKAMGPPLWVIGTDGGYLDTPVKIDPNLKPNDKLLIMPGERYDVIIDFGDFANQTLLLRNTGRTPFPKGEAPPGSTLGRIIQFRVGAVPSGGDSSYDPDPTSPTYDGDLRTGNPIQRLVDPAAGTPAVAINKKRQLTLNEVIGPGGPLEILVNNTKWNGGIDGDTTNPVTDSEADGFGNFLTELPQEGQTEEWEIINLTADAHPIHLHLVQFQVMNRQNYNVKK